MRCDAAFRPKRAEWGMYARSSSQQQQASIGFSQGRCGSIAASDGRRLAQTSFEAGKQLLCFAELDLVRHRVWASPNRCGAA